MRDYGDKVDWTEVEPGVWKSPNSPETIYTFEASFDEAFAAFTAPERRTVLKSVIISRLIEAGKIEAAKAALEQDASAYARWWAPDRPAIYHDDPDALALLNAIGADPDVILAE